MSVASFERELLRELKEVTGNPKLTRNSWVEWSTTPVKAEGEEKLAYLPKIGVHVAYKDKK